jgi:4-hydroxybenzoate polyprenyltransferase
VLAARALNPLCGWLSLPVLVVLLGYSAVKRFSSAAHFVLGLALALAPLGAWVAVRGDLSGDLAPPLLLRSPSSCG